MAIFRYKLQEPVPNGQIFPIGKFCFDNWRAIAWLVIAGFAMAILWVPPWDRPFRIYFWVGSFTASLWVLLWIGNAYTANLVSYFYSWTERPVTRFLVGIVVMVVYTMLVLYGVVFVYETFFGIRFQNDMTQVVWISLSITVVISLFMHGRAFLSNWKNAELSAAELQKENIRAQYDSLRSQVNPHFLFNSLNALTNLIHDHPDKAVKFVKQLSEVYRYVLDTQGKEVVPLAEEVKFLQSYLFLQQIRFGDKLRVEVRLDNVRTVVAPLVLQMLVENAIKHNVVSSENPLVIQVYEKNQELVVENPIQPKTIMLEESKGIGLENIRKRYSFLSSKPVVVDSAGGVFTVRLPIIEP